MKSLRLVVSANQVAYLLLVLLSSQVSGAPLFQQGSSHASFSENPAEYPSIGVTLVDYLKNFGYLIDEDLINSRSQGEEKAIEKSIELFHRFINIEAPRRFNDDILNQMNKLRCGNKDIVDRKAVDKQLKEKRMHFVISGFKWARQPVTYKLENYPRKFRNQRNQVDQIFHEAFQAWSDPTASLQFAKYQPILSRDPPDIRINFVGEGASFSRIGSIKNILGYTVEPTIRDNITSGGDIYFNDNIDWSLRKSDDNSPSLLANALHHIGHALGFRHAQVGGVVMSPISAELEELTKDEIAGIQNLYDKFILERTTNISKPFIEETPTAPPPPLVEPEMPPPPASNDPNTHALQPATSSSNSEEPQTEAVAAAPICGSNGQWWFRGPTCRQYYDCTSGKPILKSCPGNLLWKHEKIWCDYPENVYDCKDN